MRAALVSNHRCNPGGALLALADWPDTMGMRKTFASLIFAALSLLTVASASAQVCSPVPALPDSERRTQYAISAQTGPFAVGFAVYGDSTDYGDWIAVYLNGALQSVANYTVTSPTTTLATGCRPITDLQVTFPTAQTGTLQIVGARRPRRTSQFGSRQPAARDMDQIISDLVAQNRELWDKTNDVTGRVVLARPGETLALLPVLASRANMGACFDGSGNLSPCVSVPSGTFTAGNGITFTGVGPTSIAAAATYAAGTGIQFTGTFPTTISFAPSTVVIYVCPSTATANQQLYCKFTGNGTTDQTAINSAIALAGTSSPSQVILLPGAYTITTPVDIKQAASSIFDARGTVTNCTSVTDCFTINRGQVTSPMNSIWQFGTVTHSGTSVAIRSFGQFSDGYISWQKINGTSKQGIGFYMDADHTDGGASQSVITLGVGEIFNEADGILLSTNTGTDLIDTVVANTINGYLHDNNFCVRIRSQGTTRINSNTWNLNIDASWSASAVAFQTNGSFDQVNNIVGLGANYSILSGASGNDFSKSYPYSLAFGAALSDVSGNTSNIYPIYATQGRIAANAGALIEWGTININATSCGTVSVPAFPNNFFSVQVTMKANVPTTSLYAPSAQIINASNFTLCNNFGVTQTFMWTAFGN